jgi:hypothetical protein
VNSPEASIVVPGAFTRGTNHFTHSGSPTDTAIVAEYETRYGGLSSRSRASWPRSSRPTPRSPRSSTPRRATDPYRVYTDPSDDGAAIVVAVGDRVRAELLRRIGPDDVLQPAK